jgi:DNA-directed RNA polymerase subunit alpha
MFVFSEPKIKSQKINNNLSNFFISPLNKGFGITLGNALRRTLLSTIPGSSIFAIKLNDVKHEFSTVTGIVEDVNMIILNLKKLVVKIDDSISNSEFANFKIEN